MEERPAAARGDVQALAEVLATVVVGVAREHEGAVALDRDVEPAEDLLPRRARLEEGVGGIGHHQDHAAALTTAGLGEVGALLEVDDAELAIRPPEIEPRRQAERPVARALHRRVAEEREHRALADEAADAEGLDPLDEMAELAGAVDLIGVDARGPIERALAAAEHAPEAVEARVPVVVARHAEEHAVLAVLRLPQDLVPGTMTRLWISSSVATGYAVSPPKSRRRPRGSTRRPPGSAGSSTS